MAPKESPEELARILEEIQNEKVEKLTSYQRDLLKWSRNIDRRYAWVVLLASWLIVFSTLGAYRLYSLVFVKIVEDGHYTREEASGPVLMIATVQALSGMFVSILNFYVSARVLILFGSASICIANALATFSSSLLLDTLLLGVLQGVGYGSIYMLLMGICNSYFLKYRAIALGAAMSGGTFAVFALEPVFKWILDEYPWRYSYLAMAAVVSIAVIASIAIKPYPRPVPPEETEPQVTNKPSKICALESTISIKDAKRLEAEQATDTTHDTVGGFKSAPICNSSFVHSNIAGSQKVAMDLESGPGKKTNKQEPMGFNLSLMISILRVPAFHLIWFNMLLFFWVFSIYCLILVDYGRDRGLSTEQANSLLKSQSIGELVGRIAFPIFLDMGYLSNRWVTILNYTLMCSMLTLVTIFESFIPLTLAIMGISATCNFVTILVSKLLVEHLGEQLATLGFGMSYFICGLLVIFRSHVIGFFRDQMGSYDMLMISMSAGCALCVISWILEPPISRLFKRRQTA